MTKDKTEKMNIDQIIIEDVGRFLESEWIDPFEEQICMSLEEKTVCYGSAPTLDYNAAEEKRAFSSLQKSETLDDVLEGLGRTFQEMLLHLIDEKGLTDTEVYKSANLDRKLFSKIRCNKDYKPSKSTALALAIALRLSLDETADLLGRAGLAISPSSKSDLIVKYCILHGIYDIISVNEILYAYDQPLIGS